MVKIKNYEYHSSKDNFLGEGAFSKVYLWKYIGSNKIILTNPKIIEIYEWGFRIDTGTPISMVAIKNTYYKQGVFNSKDLYDKLKMDGYDNGVMEFVIPEEALDIKLLRYYWHKGSENSDALNDILFDTDDNANGEDILDVGQYNYDIVDLD